MSAAIQAPYRMTVAEFQAWEPPLGMEDHRWELVDGEPTCMSPPSVTHGAIKGQAAFLLMSHFAAHRPACRVIVGPGVVPRARATMNERVPDLAVTRTPSASDGKYLTAPVFVLEILSPSNETRIRRNVWAYCTIPTVSEILLLASTSIGAELLRRGDDGNWPEEPVILGLDDTLELASLGLGIELRAFYRTTSLA